MTGTHHPGSGADAWLRGFTSLLVLLFPTVTLFVNRGDSYVFGLLTLVGLYVWLRDGARVWLDRYSGALWIAFLLFFAVAVLSYLVGLQTEDGFHFLGRYLRFLLIAPVYLAFRRYPPTAKTLFIGLALGALVSGVLSMLQFLHTHTPFRMAATTDLSIIFGDLATTMVLCTAAGLALLASSRRSWTLPLLILCLAGGLAATLLSGTRGAWIPLLLLPLAFIAPYGAFLKARYVALIFAVIVLTFGISYMVPRTATQARLGMISAQVYDYFAALGSFSPRVDPGAGNARCVNGQSFLRAWIAAGRLAGDVPAQVSVVPDPGLMQTAAADFGCRAGFAVRISNLGGKGAAQYVLPRVPEESVSSQQTTVLARGAAVVSFAGGGSHHASVNNAVYKIVKVAGGHAAGKAVNVFVAPGESVWLVPLESYFGEYSFAPADNNVGQRLEMWRAAWHLFLRHPLLGVGLGAYQAQSRELASQHDIAPFVGTYDHPHNDYLNALASAGLLGLLALLAVLVVPLVRFVRVLRSRDALEHAIGLAGTLSVFGFAIYALTDTVFLHSMMITWYVIYMALFVALIQDRVTKQENGIA
ncbi:MAG: O-antigen ligase family protein [Gammaproteobacteria bacterium]|nr:O-antigen ligase family protein [Gammaproteobacteria bacterium]